MKVPLEWLGEWSQWKGSPQELAEKLTQSGTEVVAIHSTGCQVRGIVSAKILEKKPHPNADRLRDRKSTRLNSSHAITSRMPSSA